MKTFTPSVETDIAATQLGVCELVDIYLSTPIVTPWGTTSILRLTNLPGGVNFFTPQFSPEDEENQGVATQYNFWPMSRETINADSKFTNDAMVFTASNVTDEFRQMISAVEWRGAGITIRELTSPGAAGLMAEDCIPIFSGTIDAPKITLQALSFSCSNGMGVFQSQWPNEAMHYSCRFRWGDDQCTVIKLRVENYKTKTVGSGSTTTVLKSADLTEDTWNLASPPADEVDALADANITTSSELTGYSNAPVKFTPVAVGHSIFYYFYFNPSGPTLTNGTKIKFAGTTMPSPLVAGTWYYAFLDPSSGKYFVSTTTSTSGAIATTSAGAAVTLTTDGTFQGNCVKVSKGGWWKFNYTSNDWGVASQGYWQIPDAQAGLTDGALKPYIQFDFGSAKQLRTWRVSSINQGRESMVRLIQLFSSSNATDWNFESYFEMPPQGETLFDILLPFGSTARYWRICVRTRWSETFRTDLFKQVSAYAASKNYWFSGRIVFDQATTTAALRGVRAYIFSSAAGQITTSLLPVAPAAGDTFVIMRGCGRTFNGCARHRNTENHGGFTTMPDETVIK